MMEARALFGKRLTAEERRIHVARLIEEHGAALWRICLRLQDTEDGAGALWLQTFQKIYTDRKKTAAAWTDEQLRQYAHALAAESALDTADEVVALRQVRGRQEETGVASVAAENEGAEEAEETVDIPLWLRIRCEQMLKAEVVLEDAVRRHRGPIWTRVALLLTTMIGAAAVVYGGYNRWPRSVVTLKVPAPANESTALPSPLGNLPVTPVGEFRLPASMKADLPHVAVDRTSLYVPKLQVAADTWPRIDVQIYPLTMQGQLLTDDKPRLDAVELVPPLGHSGNAQSNSKAWTVGNWHISVTGNWLIATVGWLRGTTTNKGMADVTQIYAMNLSTGKSSLVESLLPQTDVANEFIVAVGDNKVAVQSGLTQGGHDTVSLPVAVYALSGDNPLRALSPLRQLPASFGMMKNPVATHAGLVFQGFQGTQAQISTGTELWDVLNWNGQLNKLVGPPVDGQPHYAVQGASGALWWVETTPDPSHNQSYDVSMGALADTAKASMPAMTLAGSVVWLGVDNGHLLWLQDAAGVAEFVIAQVQ